MEYGFKLIGKLVASRVQQGTRKDDGVPYCLILNSIGVGQSVVNYTQSVEPKPDVKPLELYKDVEISNISRANMNGNMITVNGDLKYIK